MREREGESSAIREPKAPIKAESRRNQNKRRNQNRSEQKKREGDGAPQCKQKEKTRETGRSIDATLDVVQKSKADAKLSARENFEKRGIRQRLEEQNPVR